MYEKMDKERFDESEQWFILRDLKRPNSKSPAALVNYTVANLTL